MKTASLNSMAHRAPCFFKHCSCNKPSSVCIAVIATEPGAEAPSQTCPQAGFRTGENEVALVQCYGL